jgi:hypothetical protein
MMDGSSRIDANATDERSMKAAVEEDVDGRAKPGHDDEGTDVDGRAGSGHDDRSAEDVDGRAKPGHDDKSSNPGHYDSSNPAHDDRST